MEQLNEERRWAVLHSALRAAKWRRFFILAMTIVWMVWPRAGFVSLLEAQPNWLFYIFPLAIIIVGALFVSASQEIARYEHALGNWRQTAPTDVAAQEETWARATAANAEKIDGMLGRAFCELLLAIFWILWVLVSFQWCVDIFFARRSNPALLFMAMPLCVYLVLGVRFSAMLRKNLQQLGEKQAAEAPS